MCMCGLKYWHALRLLSGVLVLVLFLKNSSIFLYFFELLKIEDYHETC